ncbi:hypothetical protein ACSHWB_21535 [Lentzea sp. HUAS TT2]|uniref:hypothetical protein n=1 Tax=Lentzea sp. HUAS TT2 TaxID=3447454 RepID=UPI003F70FDD4
MVSDNELLDDVRAVLRAEVAAAVAAVVLIPAATRPAPVNAALELTSAALDGVRGMVIHEQAVVVGDKYLDPGQRGWPNAGTRRTAARSGSGSPSTAGRSWT